MSIGPWACHLSMQEDESVTLRSRQPGTLGQFPQTPVRSLPPNSQPSPITTLFFFCLFVFSENSQNVLTVRALLRGKPSVGKDSVTWLPGIIFYPHLTSLTPVSLILKSMGSLRQEKRTVKESNGGRHASCSCQAVPPEESRVHC